VVWFWLWAIVGAGAAFSCLSFLGIFTAVPTVVGLLLLGRSTAARPWWFGTLTGAGLMLVYIAWINRNDEHGPFNPWPWFVGGVVLMTFGVGAQLYRSVRRP
jgi:hypothetical protein